MKRNFLVFEDLELTDKHIIGGVALNQQINKKGDFEIGNTSCAEISFTTIVDVSNYMRRPLIWKTQYDDDREVIQGRFYITDIVKKRLSNGTTSYVCKAYDDLMFFDTNVDDFINQFTEEKPLTEFFTSLCNTVGVVGRFDGINGDLIVKNNFSATNISARTVLGYIAEVAGGFAMCDENGVVEIRQYRYGGHTVIVDGEVSLDGVLNIENGSVVDDVLIIPAVISMILDNTMYSDNTYEYFSIQPIDRVSENSGVVFAGSGTNQYVLNDNPLLYAETSAEIQEYINNLYNYLSTIVYTPASVSTLKDFDIRVGDIIKVNDNIFYVMSRKVSKAGVVLECYGNEKRDQYVPTVDSEVKALRGRTNTLTRTLEETTSKLTKMVGKDEIISVINQTAEQVTIDASKINFNGAVSANEKFKINTDGTMEASGAKIEGSFNMTGGSINVETDSQYASLMKINATTTNGNHYSSEITGVGLTVINEANGTKGAYNGSSFAISDNNTHKDYISGGEMPLGSDKGGVLTIANGNGDSCKIYPTTIMFMDSNNNVKGQYSANNTPVLLLTHNTASWASTAHGDYYSYLLCACAGQGNRVVASTLIPRAFISTSTDSSNPCMAYLEGGYRVYCYFSGGNIYARTEGINADCYVKVYGMY